MAILEYPYDIFEKSPVAPCIAVNLINGFSWPFFGVLDTGASIAGLMEEVFVELDIDVKSLPKDNFDGSSGIFPGRLCDFIKIALVEPFTFKNHWPNDHYSVPVGLVHGERNLLGRDLFLDRCILTFDGPDQIAYVDLGAKNVGLSGRRKRR